MKDFLIRLHDLHLMKGLYVCLVGLVLTSCGPSAPEKLRLSSWVSSPSETAIFKATLEEFRQRYPDNDFVYEPIPGNYSEKLQLMLGTHTAPDVFFLKGLTAPSYMSFGILKPLDSFIQADSSFNPDDFYEFSLEAFQRDGVQFGIPKDFNPYVLFYNKKLFREAGIDSLPQTWAEFQQVAGQLTKDLDGDGKSDQFGMIVEPSIEMVMPYVYQNGGAFQHPDGSLGITDDAFVGAIEYYYGLYQSGVATIPQDQGVSWNGDAFGREITAMAVSSGWLIPFLKDNYPELEYGIIPMPAGKQRATVAFTTAFSLPKETNYDQEAWEIVSYLTGKEGMAAWTKSGVAMPTRKSVAEANGLETDSVFSVFIESAEYARPFQVRYSERGFEEVVVAFQAIFFTGKSPREAMEDISEQIQKYKLVGNDQ